MTRKLSRAEIMQLHELGAMKDKGILTAEEFAAEKGMLLTSARRQLAFRGSRLWLAGSAAVLVLVLAIVGIATGGSAARQPDRATASAQH